MALKVVPAGDERCDIHNHRRNPPKYVCQTCLTEFGLDADASDEPRRRSLGPRLRRIRRRLRRRIARRDRGLLVGGGMAVTVVGVLAIVLATGRGGAEPTGTGGPPTQADVINALELVPDPNGGWTTPDGACWIVSLQFGTDVHPGPISGKALAEAANENATVGAAVSQNDFSVSEAQCVARIGAALKAHF
jgi:hypothetical protein